MIGFYKNTGLCDQPEFLVGRHIYLRLPRSSDWDAWSKLRRHSREFLSPWEPTWSEKDLSRSSFRRRNREQMRGFSNGKTYPFFLFSNSDQNLLGGITLGNLKRGSVQSANVGYWIGEIHARQGYMIEGLNCALAYAFKEIGLHRVEAACMPKNIASKGLLERSGFKLEGCVREYLYIDGAWEDHLLYNILKTDWERSKYLE